MAEKRKTFKSVPLRVKAIDADQVTAHSCLIYNAVCSFV